MKTATVLLAALVGVSVFAFLQYRGGLFGTPVEHYRSEAFLSELAEEVSKDLPLKLDEETQLTSVEGLEGVFVYNYTLLNLDGSEVDADRLVRAIKPKATRTACTTATNDKILKSGVTLRYAYTDKFGRAVTSFEIHGEECP